VLDSRTGKPVGHISIGNIDWEQKTGRLSRVLVGCPEARSRGYGQAMVRAIVALGFGALGLHRLGLGAYESNHRALHCYQRCGFQHIGTLRHVLRYEDEYWSSVEMSLQAEDWRRMQGNSGEQRRAWRRNQGRNTSKSR
jgi:RimJ/RimL family protein N-acetyltransferase